MIVVASIKDRKYHIEPIERFLPNPIIYDNSQKASQLLNLNPDLVIFMSDWTHDLKECVRELRKNRIPTVLLMDGTIEWKHFFDNPKWSKGGNEAPYLPVFCDKIFVPGNSTYRFLNFFGNSGKCEITGLPRFDSYKDLNIVKYKKPKKVIGIMSANTAGYSAKQLNETKQIFTDLKNWSLKQDKVKFIWRIRKNFNQSLKLNIENDKSEKLTDFLGNVDAVICQPSTAIYECMQFNIPTAICDYNIAPNYMRAAWEINSSSQINDVVNELINPSELKMTLQYHLLEDNLAYLGNSAKMCADIISEMINQSKSMKINKWIFQKNIFKMYLANSDKTLLSHDIFDYNYLFTFNDLSLLKEEATKLFVKNKKLEIELKKFSLTKLLAKIIIYIKNI